MHTNLLLCRIMRSPKKKTTLQKKKEYVLWVIEAPSATGTLESLASCPIVFWN